MSKNAIKRMPPSRRQVEQLRSFDGDPARLGSAERFLLSLLSVPCYALRLEGLLLRAEFQGSVDVITPRVKAFVTSCEGIIESQSLRQFLRFVLQTGNFINSVSYYCSTNY